MQIAAIADRLAATSGVMTMIAGTTAGRRAATSALATTTSADAMTTPTGAKKIESVNSLFRCGASICHKEGVMHAR